MRETSPPKRDLQFCSDRFPAKGYSLVAGVWVLVEGDRVPKARRISPQMEGSPGRGGPRETVGELGPPAAPPRPEAAWLRKDAVDARRWGSSARVRREGRPRSGSLSDHDECGPPDRTQNAEDDEWHVEKNGFLGVGHMLRGRGEGGWGDLWGREVEGVSRRAKENVRRLGLRGRSICQGLGDANPGQDDAARTRGGGEFKAASQGGEGGGCEERGCERGWGHWPGSEASRSENDYSCFGSGGVGMGSTRGREKFGGRDSRVERSKGLSSGGGGSSGSSSRAWSDSGLFKAFVFALIMTVTMLGCGTASAASLVDENVNCSVGCHHFATCSNLTVAGATANESGYASRCVCSAGYQGDGANCDNIDECALGTDGCVAPAACNDTNGSFFCSCPSSFWMLGDDNISCTALAPCEAETDNCAEVGSTCTSFEVAGNGTSGGSYSYTCECTSGYAGNGSVCDDVPECATGADNCPSSTSRCIETVGSFECECVTPGYRENPGSTQPRGLDCEAVGPCERGTDDCDINATCLSFFIDPSNTGDATNTTSEISSLMNFSCTCNLGYFGPGSSCDDVDECQSSVYTDLCASRGGAHCNNTVGSFLCGCPAGYLSAGNNSVYVEAGDSCVDVNECTAQSSDTYSNDCYTAPLGSQPSTCTNTPVRLPPPSIPFDSIPSLKPFCEIGSPFFQVAFGCPFLGFSLLIAKAKDAAA